VVGVQWDDLYASLIADREDPLAYAMLEHRVRRWASRALMRRGWHVVEDVVADTCVRVLLGLDGAHGPATFVAFVHGHFRNACRPYIRNTYGCHSSLDGVDVAAPIPELGPSQHTLARLRDALGCLPERERRAVLLRYFENRPTAGIAAELGVTTLNARRIVCNGLARLRRQFASAA